MDLPPPPYSQFTRAEQSQPQSSAISTTNSNSNANMIPSVTATLQTEPIRQVTPTAQLQPLATASSYPTPATLSAAAPVTPGPLSASSLSGGSGYMTSTTAYGLSSSSSSSSSVGYASSSRSASYASYPGKGTRPGEVKLYSSVTERRQFEDLANFYSIVKALDVLECAFTKDAVTSEEYESECSKLLAQHKTQESALRRSGVIKDTAEFMMKFKQLHCPHAMNRINEGKAATQALQQSSGDGVNSLAAFEAASQVITAKDEIAMDITRVQDIHPLLRDIVDSFSRFDFPGSGQAKIMAWVVRLNSLSATEELSDEDKQQMDFDLQLTYDELHKYLKSKS